MSELGFSLNSSTPSRFQTQRSELKYLITEAQAVRVRSFVRAHMALDPYGARQADLSYPVHSLYLDSPDLALHHSTINGERNRYKLRIRFYEHRLDGPVYCEIKRRRDEAIFKERVAVPRELVAEILAGRLPSREHLKPDSDDAERALLNFFQHVAQLRARPIAHVTYRREAWHSPGHNRLRVTFDRQVSSSLESSARMEPTLVNPVLVFGSQVVLELKFTGHFPGWMGEMVRACGIRQCSAAKYVDGILLMEQRGLEPTAPLRRRIGAARGRRLAGARS